MSDNKITVHCEASQTKRTVSFSLMDVECATMKEWENLSQEEQLKRLDKLCEGLPEQPYWTAGDYFH